MNWDEDIKEIEEFLEDRELPMTLGLTKQEAILNVRNFFESHMEIVKANKGNKTFLPYLIRMKLAKSILCQ